MIGGREKKEEIFYFIFTIGGGEEVEDVEIGNVRCVVESVESERLCSLFLWWDQKACVVLLQNLFFFFFYFFYL